MQVFIVDADNENNKIERDFSFSPEAPETAESEIGFNLLNPFVVGESSGEGESSESENLSAAFGYSLTLKQLKVSSSLPDGPLQLTEKSCTFYYDCGNVESFPIFLKIDKKTYDNIEQVNSDYVYEVSWKKFVKSSVKYTYQDFIYYAERKKKIDFDLTTFAKEVRTLDLTELANTENFFNAGSDLEIIGFENKNLSGGAFQVIPLGSSMFFDDKDEKNYTFSFLAEGKEEKFPLDFFINKSNIGNGITSPSGGEEEVETGGNEENDQT
jgi:hypothetical protein